MGTREKIPPEEIEAYQQARLKLLAIAQTKPWLLEISVALEGRTCVSCHKKAVIENPSYHFRCTKCGAVWEQAAVIGYARRSRGR